MKTATRLGGMLLPLLLVGGCIVGDQLTTVTIQPDGSAELVIYRSNLHSTEKGEKAARELTEYKDRFDAQSEDEFARVRDVGGRVLDARWIRPQAPFANVVRYHFPAAAVLEKYATAAADNGGSITTSFHRDGAHRRLTVRIVAPPDNDEPAATPPLTVEQLRQNLANGLSETRIAVADGVITAARGFIVAGDRQSALLYGEEIAALIRKGGGSAELFLEWDVTE